jgi:tetratricopeptide (TPR) repeat protein
MSTSLLILSCAALPATACAQVDSPARQLQHAQEALRTGAYDDARSSATKVLTSDAASAPALRVLTRALLLTGHAASAESAATAFVRANVRSGKGYVPLGEALLLRGRLVDAESAFVRATRARASDSLTANVRLAQLRFDRGEVDDAMRGFERFIDIYNERRARLTASELQAVALACRYLGRNDPQLFKDALKAFDDAIGKDSLDLDVRVRLAELFLEKYNSADAKVTLGGVLAVNPRHPEALLAMARVRQFDFAGDAADVVRRSLEVNGTSPSARALSALLLIDLERFDDAIAEATLGLADDSVAYEPLTALAAAYYLKGDTARSRAALERAVARRPRSADAEATLADVMARNRLYTEAVGFAKHAVARDEKASRALAFLGVNALRIGDRAGGRTYLERSFALDPFDVWAKNTLDLLDTYKDYDEVRTPRFVFLIEKKDAPLLSLYAGPLAEAAFDSLSARYGYTPTGPVRVEVYRSHADFSVRTVGLAGLGALGVSFGDVVAIDGPASRKPGEFNWGSTLWHELAHTFTLGASAGKVPRWFSEGLSVYEERRARPGWGDDVSPQFLAAFKGGLLVPIARMNDGFMRPTFPEQILLSYYEASLLSELIERDHGINAIRLMLLSYRHGLSTDSTVQVVLKTDVEGLQRRFDAFVREKFAPQLEAVDAGKVPAHEGPQGVDWGGKFADAMRTAVALMEAKEWEQAIAQLEHAKRLFPTFAGEESAYGLLARIALERGDTTRAIAELKAMTAINQDAYGATRTLADLLAARGDDVGATAALDRAMYIFPHETAPHEQLAELAAKSGAATMRVRERRAILALDPTDRVEALYQLALALADAGDRINARREVLRALELAPNFEKGQDLLLRLRGSGAGGQEPAALGGELSPYRNGARLLMAAPPLRPLCSLGLAISCGAGY